VDDPKDESLLVLARAGCRWQVTRGLFVFAFLKIALDDASTNRRAKISAIYGLLLAANAVIWTWAAIASADRRPLAERARG
jgi:hypothetical protein